MANQQRGETTIKIGGKEFTMRPTFQALCDIEDRVGMGIPELIMRLSSGDVRLKYIIPVIHAGVTAFNIDSGITPSPSYEELGKLIIDSGFRDAFMASPTDSPVAEFLLKGINGGRIVDAGETPGKKKTETPPE